MKIKIKKSILLQTVRQILNQGKIQSRSIPAANRGMDLWNPKFKSMLQDDIQSRLNQNVNDQYFRESASNAYCDNSHSANVEEIKSILLRINKMTQQQINSLDQQNKIWQWMQTII